MPKCLFSLVAPVSEKASKVQIQNIQFCIEMKWLTKKLHGPLIIAPFIRLRAAAYICTVNDLSLGITYQPWYCNHRDFLSLSFLHILMTSSLLAWWLKIYWGWQNERTLVYFYCISGILRIYSIFTARKKFLAFYAHCCKKACVKMRKKRIFVI